MNAHVINVSYLPKNYNILSNIQFGFGVYIPEWIKNVSNMATISIPFKEELIRFNDYVVKGNVFL